MKKRFWMYAAQALVFVLLLGGTVHLLTNVLIRKESRDLLGGYLEETENYDVVFFGDSKLVSGVSPWEMWEDYGIASYNLASYGCLMPVSYWSLINALDYGTPELAVFAVNGFTPEKKVAHYSPDVHTEIDFWPMTLNKVRMINDLMHHPENPDYADAQGDRYRDLKWEFFFPIAKFHSRWSELTKEDFSKRPQHIKGGEFLVGVAPIWEYTLTDEEEYAPEEGYAFSYLRMAIEECQSRGVDVLLLHMPSPIRINSQRYANTARSIAAEYGVNFVDLTLLDSIVDYAVDCVDTDPHLNTSGALKVSSYLGSYIREHYDLPDTREDARYAHWYSLLETYKHDKMDDLKEQDDLNNVLMLLHDTDYDLSMYLDAQSDIWYDDLAISLMHNIVREHVLCGEEYEKWSNFMYPLEQFDNALRDGGSYYLQRRAGVWMECTDADADRAAREAFGENDGSVSLIEVMDARTGEKIKQMQF